MSHFPAPYRPSPVTMVRQQVADFEATGGAQAGTHKGRPVVILTTVGAATGALRKTPLMKVEHDGRYALVATFGGSPTPPKWYLNIERDPLVHLQDGNVRSAYRARILGADDPELEPWWARAEATFPAYREYRRQLQGIRDVPLVVLEPLTAATTPEPC